MANEPDQPVADLRWRGIHHVALATPDIERAARFYHEVLAMPVSEIYPSRAGRGRHCLVFVKPGDEDTWGIHFFERPVTTEAAARFLHIAFRLPDETSAALLRERLTQHQIAITDIAELGSFVFDDPDGMMVEITWNRDAASS